MNSKTFAEILDEAFEQSCRMDASLNERLQAFADTVRKLNPTFAEAVDRLVVRLQEKEPEWWPHQHQRAGRGAVDSPGRGRPDRRHPARAASVRQRTQGRGQGPLSHPARHGQRLCHVTQPRDLGRRGDEADDGGDRAGTCPPTRATTPGCCRSLPPSSLPATDA